MDVGSEERDLQADARVGEVCMCLTSLTVTASNKVVWDTPTGRL